MAVVVVRHTDGPGMRKDRGVRRCQAIGLSSWKDGFHQVSWRRLGKSQSRGPAGIGHTEFEMLVRYSSGENQQAVGNSNLQYESCYGFRDGVGYHYLLQVIFPIQGSNPSILHWQAESLPSESPGKPVRSKVRFKRCFSAPRYFSFTLETESELFKVLYILVAF